MAVCRQPRRYFCLSIAATQLCIHVQNHCFPSLVMYRLSPRPLHTQPKSLDTARSLHCIFQCKHTTAWLKESHPVWPHEWTVFHIPIDNHFVRTIRAILLTMNVVPWAGRNQFIWIIYLYRISVWVLCGHHYALYTALYTPVEWYGAT